MPLKSRRPPARKPRILPGLYRHYKGKYYRVLGTARHSETLELFVVYRALYESPDFGKNSLWVRPAGMFLEKVHVKGKRMPRFRRTLRAGER